ncbi:unnamed protein product [Toxocara canis]|nr:unnamed protein product [Toxocara canis]
MYASACIYILTMKVGLIGNVWVICSVLRNRRPRNNLTHLSTSDRLRSYIFALALIDFVVVSSLCVRVIYTLLPSIHFEIPICRAIFFMDHLVKLASVTCLACISIERYITIRKPFNSQIRKRLFKMTPLFAIGMLLMILSALLLKAGVVTVNANHMDCRQLRQQSALLVMAGLVVAFAFITLLAVVSINYGQIVRHVRRKFWKRKARVCANLRQHQPLVSEPRYMRDMTSAIVRVAVFHIICWLPYCVFQLLPDEVSSVISTSVRMLKEREASGGDWLGWVSFIVNWFTYVNSACDWVFYAVLNRDLRTLIRTNTERRKRSTLSQYSSPNPFHYTLRRQVSSGLRFFQSVNSTKSAQGSFDECVPISTSVPPHSQIIVPPSPKFSNYSADYMAYSNGPDSPQFHSSCSHKTSTLIADGVEEFV